METMTIDEKLNQIINSCCEQELEDKEEFNKIFSDLVEIYKEDDYRHRYDEITRIIISKRANIAQIGEGGSLMNVSKNLFKIYNKAKEDSKEENSKVDENVLKKIEKLFVHVNLECIRLRNFNDNFNRVSEAIKNYDAKIKDYDEKIKDHDEKMGNLKQEEQDIKESLEKQQTQYITILGIFASIVLAFVGGLTFSNSVLAHIHQASIYRLVFVMSFIALFVGNILYYLFDFLSKIAIRQKEEVPCYEKPIFCFNVIILIIMFIIGTVYYVRENQTHEVKGDSSAHNRIKSLNICGKFDINCIDIAEFLRRERAKFVLEQGAI